MSENRPHVISIAGLDPSAGAGLLADVKCFEQHKVYGFGICSALTIQTDDEFFSNEWIKADQIIAQIVPLQAKYNIRACKIGLIKDLDTLKKVVDFLKSRDPSIAIVLDPVLKSSTGYNFHNWEDSLNELIPVLRLIEVITPNYLEMKILCGNIKVEEATRNWARYCAVLLKGGHNDHAIGTDYLFTADTVNRLDSAVSDIYQKHGSGCVLSAAITANLALNYALPEACLLAKKYIENFLNSNSTLLGYHS